VTGSCEKTPLKRGEMQFRRFKKKLLGALPLFWTKGRQSASS
jgi:hypothetical protein